MHAFNSVAIDQSENNFPYFVKVSRFSAKYHSRINIMYFFYERFFMLMEIFFERCNQISQILKKLIYVIILNESALSEYVFMIKRKLTEQSSNLKTFYNISIAILRKVTYLKPIWDGL